jgi:REP element-mobilizing transposase RayT
MKKIRLEKEIYGQQGRPCHITICCQRDLVPFAKAEYASYCMSLLEGLCRDYNVQLYVYCFMPDHLHFIISLRGRRSIIDLVGGFKSMATKGSRRFGFDGRVFQSRFFDHFIRTVEELEREILYILNNPARKRLVENGDDYLFRKCFL